MVQARVGVPVPIGNEGAGTVVAAGSSDAAEITTTFASTYTATVSLEEALSVDAVSVYGRQATGARST